MRSGRYGPYINHAKTNATIPRTMKPEEVSLELAIALLAERESRGAGRRKAPSSRKASGTKPKAGAKPRPARAPKTAKADIAAE